MVQETKEGLKIKLTDLKIKASYINDPSDDLQINLPEDVKYSIRGGIGVNREASMLISQIEIDAFYQKTSTSKKHELFGITSETYFLVENINNLYEDAEVKIPKDFATKILNIGIGNTRGLLKGIVLSNVHYINCTLPLITVPVAEGEEIDE